MTQPATADPDLAAQLRDARRGTAYFAQKLAELSDADFDEATLLAGWSRRHVIAQLAYNAQALGRLLDWAATGTETPMYASGEQRSQEINDGATLTPTALRNLFSLSTTSLDEKWQHLPTAAWSTQVRTAQGRLVPASETPWMRTREVWIHAVDIDNGACFGDFPDALLTRLLADITGMWRKNELGAGIGFDPDDHQPTDVHPDAVRTTTVAGPLPSVVRWAAGRGAVGLNIVGDPEPPAWL